MEPAVARADTRENIEGQAAGEIADLLSPEEIERVSDLRRAIDEYYKALPTELRDAQEAQEHCLTYLLSAEKSLTPPITRAGIIRSRLDLTRVQIEIGRVKSSKFSFMIVVAIVYVFAVLVGLAFSGGILAEGLDGKEMNKRLIMGLPLPIVIWSVIGSFTSMLLRAGQLPFSNRQEALRWLLFRPIVGVVMGVMTYLMVSAGLIVFTGTSHAQTPELLWVIAFVGAFSDTLSVDLLQKIIGRFQAPEGSSRKGESTETEGKGTTQKPR